MKVTGFGKTHDSTQSTENVLEAELQTLSLKLSALQCAILRTHGYNSSQIEKDGSNYRLYFNQKKNHDADDRLSPNFRYTYVQLPRNCSSLYTPEEIRNHHALIEHLDHYFEIKSEIAKKEALKATINF